jgi:hypothetical protein
MPLKARRCGLVIYVVCAGLVVQEFAAHPTSDVRLYTDVDMPHTPHNDRAPTAPAQVLTVSGSTSTSLSARGISWLSGVPLFVSGAPLQRYPERSVMPIADLPSWGNAPRGHDQRSEREGS